MFLDELKKRNVPSLKSRAEMLELLQREEYGCLPKAPESFVWEAEPGIADNFCAGKATLEKLTFRVVVNGKDFAADAELVNAAVAENVVAAAQHAGVA